MKITKVIEITIIEDNGKSQYKIENHLKELDALTISSALGLISAVFHEALHIQAEKHNEFIVKNKSKN